VVALTLVEACRENKSAPQVPWVFHKSLRNRKYLPKFLRNWKDMTNRFPLNMLLAGLVLMTFGGLTFAQEAQYQDIIDAKPMFKTLPNHLELAPSTVGAAGTTALTLWNGSFIDLTKREVTYTMVGTNPAVSNVSTTIPVYIIPIKMVYGSTNGNRTFDPLTAKASNGLSVVNNIIASPIFKKGVNFTQGSTNLGTAVHRCLPARQLLGVRAHPHRLSCAAWRPNRASGADDQGRIYAWLRYEQSV